MLNNNKKIRSPLFYVGDKYKVMGQILCYTPTNIDYWVEPFLGGGSSAMNGSAKKFILNDLDKNVIDIHKYLSTNANDTNFFFKKNLELIKFYNLSSSYYLVNLPDQNLKRKFVKTYYSKKNRDGYIKMKSDFNEKNNVELLYLLLVYGFNHMIRFNSLGNFNLPVGNVDFNKNTTSALMNYFDWVLNNSIEFFNIDYKDFIKRIFKKIKDVRQVFVFLDPPYLISNSEYNKNWNESDEVELYKLIDELDSNGIKFGITNLLYHKGKKNKYFDKWRKKYISIDLKSNFISSHDNTLKNSREVYVTNYEK